MTVGSNRPGRLRKFGVSDSNRLGGRSARSLNIPRKFAMTSRRHLVVGAAYVGLLLTCLGALAFLGGCGSGLAGSGQRPHGVFVVEPYLQLGDAATPSVPESLVVMWQTADVPADWSVETRPLSGESWTKGAPPEVRHVEIEGVEPFQLFRATLNGLEPGAEFFYRVLRNGSPAFEARARARRPAGQPHRFVVFGDCASDTEGQRAIAYQASLAKPDFVMIAGDIVYSRGRISEYLTRYFPIYNSAETSPAHGAPLLRSTLFLAAPGNHDLGERNLDRAPDILAYFLYWSQPQNGPDGPAASPILVGSEARRRAFLGAAGPAFPRMANFSFDYGDAHWTVLDSNLYPQWPVQALRQWLEHDLSSEPAQRAAWRIVTFHHPPFNSSRAHFEEQRMRLLVDLFEKYHVHLVISGHVHNYQRTYPLHFVAGPIPDGHSIDRLGHVPGRLTIDKTYDGAIKTKADGVIYLITGGGGAKLYTPDQQLDPASWQEFTARFVSSVHSLTICDLDAHRLTVRQISAQGEELDRFVVNQ
jgi:hypothetical protein